LPETPILSKTIFEDLDQIQNYIRGPRSVNDMLLEFLLVEAGKRGFEKGKHEKEKELKTEIEKRIKEYFSTTFNIIAFIMDRLKKSGLPVKIDQVRIIDPSFTRSFNIFFIIECEKIEDDFSFGYFLAETKRELLTNSNIFFESFFACKNDNIDMILIKNDYPYKIENLR
jgi:hypothetical protein